jgi:hypothetical protein
MKDFFVKAVEGNVIAPSYQLFFLLFFDCSQKSKICSLKSVSVAAYTFKDLDLFKHFLNSRP